MGAHPAHNKLIAVPVNRIYFGERVELIAIGSVTSTGIVPMVLVHM